MKDDFIELEDVVLEIKNLQDRKLYGDITIRMRGGNIVPLIDIKKTQKIKPKNGRDHE